MPGVRDKVLTEAFLRMQALTQKATPKVTGHSHSERTRTARVVINHEDEVVYGPRYCSVDWFGTNTVADRQRYRREILKMEQDDLVIIGRVLGDRMTHLKLTLAGQKQARALLGLPEPPPEPEKPARKRKTSKA